MLRIFLPTSTATATSFYEGRVVTHRLAKTAVGGRVALAALLSASLATAEGTTNAGSGAPPASPHASSAPSAPDDGWLAWTAIGVGGSLLAVSAWQWVVFANHNSEAGDVCPARRGGRARCADGGDQARYLSARDDAKSARTLAAILGGLGAVSLVAGILLLPDSDSSAGQPSVAISADPFAGEARADVSWAW
jgi:hypothetical protein